MANLKFRDLRADEIDCRIAMIKAGGLSLLLYKDARCDMNILDETVGAYNWKREHTRENANCIVSIWDETKSQWINKEDTGTESNTEAAKGLASDSFKRACFNWGIGRELYTAPSIWVPASACNIKDGKCYDKFTVQEITIKDKKITGLTIYNETKKEVVFQLNGSKKAPVKTAEKEPEKAPAKQAPAAPDYRAELREFIRANNLDGHVIAQKLGLKPDSTNEEWSMALEYAKIFVNGG